MRKTEAMVVVLHVKKHSILFYLYKTPAKAIFNSGPFWIHMNVNQSLSLYFSDMHFYVFQFYGFAWS